MTNFPVALLKPPTRSPAFFLGSTRFNKQNFYVLLTHCISVF